MTKHPKLLPVGAGILFALSVGLATTAMAQTGPASMMSGVIKRFEKTYRDNPPTPADAPKLKTIVLSQVGTAEDAQWERSFGVLTVRNVTRPTLYYVPADPKMANGTTVIVAPGGGFLEQQFEKEGIAVADNLAARGITVFILSYRLDPTPRKSEEVGKVMGERLTGRFIENGHVVFTSPAQDMAQKDGLDAIAYVRKHARDYNIDPQKIGLMGFSAGAMTALNVGTAYTADTRPNFIAPIYGAMQNRPVPKDAPPAFVAVAADDLLMVAANPPIYDAWRKAGKSVELHVFARGSHGFGAGRPGTSTVHWLDMFYDWLVMEKLVTPPQ